MESSLLSDHVEAGDRFLLHTLQYTEKSTPQHMAIIDSGSQVIVCVHMDITWTLPIAN